METCKRYNKLIASYVDDTASREQRDTLEQHLTECPVCARATRELVRTRRLLTKLPPLHPSPGVFAAISDRLRESRTGWLERLWWSLRPADWRAPAAAAVLLLLCVGIGTLTLYGPGATPERPQQQIMVARTYSPPDRGIVELPPDDYVTSCVLIHESFDENRAFGTPDEAQFISYGP